MIISGNRMLVLDPHQKNANHVCINMKLNKLHKYKKQLDISYCLNALDGLFDFSQETLDSGEFNGTLFRFPLRDVKTNLSDNVYDIAKISDLFNAFKAEASVELLFLNCIEKIELYDKDGYKLHKSDEPPFFTVKISESCLDDVRAKRSEFHTHMQSVGRKIAEQTFSTKVDVKIETQSGFGNNAEQSWFVLHCLKGGNLSQELATLSQDEALSNSPYVSIAVPKDMDTDFKGHVFCLMPLPLEDESLTGYPVHVNGHFALSQNRRHVKWPTADQVRNKAHIDKSIRWNNCLLVEVLAGVYHDVIQDLLQTCKANGNRKEDLDRLYRSIPDHRKITSHWDLICEPFFQTFLQTACLFSDSFGGKWIQPKYAVFKIFDPNVCEDEVALFPGQEEKFIKQGQKDEMNNHLYMMASKGLYQVVILQNQSASEIASLLQTTITKYIGSTSNREIQWRSSAPVGMNWLEKVWSYIQRYDLSYFSNLHLMPDTRTNEIYKVCVGFILKTKGHNGIPSSCEASCFTSSSSLIASAGWTIEPGVTYVIDQLLIITERYEDKYKPELLPVISDIYHFMANHYNSKDFQRLSNKKWIWTGTGFEEPEKVYLQTKSSDLVLRPYLYPLPDEFRGSHLLQFFRKIQCLERQNTNLLIKVEKMIQTEYYGGGKSEERAKADLQLVVNILNSIKNDKNVEGVLLPIKQDDETLLILKPASECNYCKDDDELFGDEQFFVHHDVSPETAEKLGVPSVTDTLLEDAERLDEWGQSEPLTRRIKNLLESYKDGLSVPKEIIQNADDAGATKVCFI
ncbi:unnamed protein product [Mytilus edulis]|uniref:Sacsin/Nov domain-containing protein n=1 Tax=Mytilus edulis TaxID=6550 RepID=A0A8S3V9A1_MYTED|nr:unnamed protein product [Mytilus edulis]